MKALRQRGISCGLALLLMAAALSAGPQESVVTGRVGIFNAENPNKEANASGVIVWLVPVPGEPAITHQTNSSQPHERLRLVQKDKSFHPHLLVVAVGDWVEFPNQDPFFHNVFSLFEGKRFDLGLYEAGTNHVVHFDRPGVSYIFCNIHPEMSAVVVALETPFFGVSDSKGDVVISAVPPGRYVLHVWHERATPDALKVLSHEVAISDDSHNFGALRLLETNALNLAHKNKYGQDYIPPSPSNAAYPRP